MILRRLSQSLKEQTWTAIVIEFIKRRKPIRVIAFVERLSMSEKPVRFSVGPKRPSYRRFHEMVNL